MTQPLLNQSDIFRIVAIDKVRKKEILIELRDKNDGLVSIKDTVKKLTTYVEDKMADEAPSNITQQIYPLMAQCSPQVLLQLLGDRMSMLLFSNDFTRKSFIHMMVVGFLLLKFVQQNNLKVVTIEKDVSDEVIKKYERVTKANSIGVTATMLGEDPKEVIRDMYKKGLIEKDDVLEMGHDVSILEGLEVETKKEDIN